MVKYCDNVPNTVIFDIRTSNMSSTYGCHHVKKIPGIYIAPGDHMLSSPASKNHKVGLCNEIFRRRARFLAEVWLNVRYGGYKEPFFDAQTQGSVFRRIGDMCENKKTLQTRGQHDIVPGMGAHTPESGMYGRFHRSEAPKVAHFWFTNVHDVGRTHEATFY